MQQALLLGITFPEVDHMRDFAMSRMCISNRELHMRYWIFGFVVHPFFVSTQVISFNRVLDFKIEGKSFFTPAISDTCIVPIIHINKLRLRLAVRNTQTATHGSPK